MVSVPPLGTLSQFRARRSKVGATGVGRPLGPPEVVVVAELLGGVGRRALVADEFAAGACASLLGAVVERGASCEKSSEAVSDAEVGFGGHVAQVVRDASSTDGHVATAEPAAGGRTASHPAIGDVPSTRWNVTVRLGSRLVFTGALSRGRMAMIRPVSGLQQRSLCTAHGPGAGAARLERYRALRMASARRLQTR